MTIADQIRIMWRHASIIVAQRRRGKFICPEHEQQRSPLRDLAPNGDAWLKHTNGDRVCSYCGSLHPDDFVEIIRLKAEGKGGHLGRSDKGYKWYANRAGVSNAGDGGIKFYTWHSPGGDFAERVNAQLDAIHRNRAA